VTTALDGRTILFVHPSDELYGADRCLLAIVRGLPPSTRAIVALPRDIEYAGELSQALMAAGAEVRRVDFAVLRRAGLEAGNWPKLVWRLTAGTLRIARLARETGATIVHTNTLAVVVGPVAALLARRAHVWHVHEVIADERWAIRLVYRLLALLPGRVIANSQATARSLAGPVGSVRRRTSVVYPGLLERQEREPASERDERRGVLRIAFVGRLTPRKGIAELLDAIALVRKRGVNVELRVFGSAPAGQGWREERYRQQASALGLEAVVYFEGFVADVQRQLEYVDVVVVPSQRPESFGLVVLEGMAAGCAVIACRNGGGSDEILEHGVTGLYCGRSASSIAAVLVRMASEPGLRARLGERARESVWGTYGVERYREGVLAVYFDLVSSRPR